MLVINDFLAQPGLHIFNTVAFFRLHSDGGGYYFQWISKGRSVITLHLTKTPEGIYRSPARGTFAGLSFSGEVAISDLIDFLSGVEAFVREKGGKAIEILLPPIAHDLVGISLQVYLLRKSGYEDVKCDLNYSMRVGSDEFSLVLGRANRKRLNKCKGAGYRALKFGEEKLADVYEVIVANRVSKGFPVTMSVGQLRSMLEVFPDRIHFFACCDGDKIIASAICMALTDNIFYVFYWGAIPGYEQYSPVVLLAEEIYGFCQSHGYFVLDVGTSTEGGVPNFGLINFKRGLGFTESIKSCYRKAVNA